MTTGLLIQDELSRAGQTDRAVRTVAFRPSSQPDPAALASGRRPAISAATARLTHRPQPVPVVPPGEVSHGPVRRPRRGAAASRGPPLYRPP